MPFKRWLRELLGMGWSEWALMDRVCERCRWPHYLKRWHDDGRTQERCANCGLMSYGYADREEG